ncbi:glycosyltransferase family 2 protein [[Clostridium] dakarense]|uniref:glycosyltransferase family 2 protein n=1 Tax=Faecalimicrobium dakarense TaxID=1301100 RepID=UPI0004B79B21|nr:glycosyltransferase family 2 protein [[Clostridium] dakarense]
MSSSELLAIEEVLPKENKNKKIYIPIRAKFFISLICATLWVAFSIYLSIPWIKDLSALTNIFMALFIIGGIAYVPGFMNAFLISSLLLDKQPKFKIGNPIDEITILVAAYNEEEGIFDTLKYIKHQEYNGKVNTIVINNNSNDRTVEEVYRVKKELNMNVTCIDEPNPGKFNALNTGLKNTTSKYVITLDADTLLHKKAIKHLVSRINSAPSDIAAVAGSVLVRNSRDNLLTKLQEWDYFLSISSIKRMQGMFQGTLVAQGAFSIYKTEIVKDLGGWSDAIGEDIILTWNMLSKNYRVYFEPLAVAFTDAPTKLIHFIRQRSRWARGMIEGLRMIKPWEQPNIYYKFLTAIDLFIPYMDFLIHSFSFQDVY